MRLLLTTVHLKLLLLITPTNNDVFADSDGDVLTLSAKGAGGEDFPGWLSFNAVTQTFSGQPGRSDTSIYADKTESIELTASDGSAQASSTFNIKVAGESYLEVAIKIAGPIISGFGVLFGAYKARGKLLNCCPFRKNKYQKYANTIEVGQPFFIQLDPPADDIVKIKAIVEDTKGCVAKVYNFVCRCCGPKMKDIPENGLPGWLEYDSNSNTISSKSGRPSHLDIGKITIQVFGDAGLLLEQFDLEVVQPDVGLSPQSSIATCELVLFNQSGNSADRHSSSSDYNVHRFSDDVKEEYEDASDYRGDYPSYSS